MTTRIPMFPAALAGAVALALCAPAFAAEGSPTPSKVPAASIKLDFGAGRRVQIACGEADLKACIEAARPVIDKVAATPAAKDGMGRHHRKDWKDRARRDKGDKGARGAAPVTEDSGATAP